MAKILLPVLTHVIAVSVGAAAWLGLGKGDGEKREEEAAADKKPVFRKEVRTERRERGVDGEKILSEITEGDGRTVHFSPRNFDQAANFRNAVAGVIKKADELEVAGDVAEAAKKALEIGETVFGGQGKTIEPEMMKEFGNAPARMLHWLRKDPEAALAYLGERNQRGYYSHAIAAAVSEYGVDAALGWNAGSDAMKRQISHFAGVELAMQGNAAKLAELKASMPEWWGRLQPDYLVPQYWPAEKREEMFGFATGENNPKMLLGFLGKQGLEGYGWLKGKLAAEDMDPAFKAALLKDPQYRDIIWKNPGIPFEERMEILGPYNKQKPPGQLALELGGRDVTGFLSEGRDWKFAYHAGSVTMEEVIAAASAALPEMAKGSPEAIRNQVYKELAEQNPEAALRDLEQFPAEQKWEMALKSARWMFQGASPQVFYDYVSKVPPNDEPEAWQNRLGAWAEHSPQSYRKLGKEYSEWVLALPEGPDREMASYGLLKHLPDKQSEVAVALREAIRDPRLVERMTSPKP